MAVRQTEFWALMPAAGSGQRMQQALPKQYIEINGTTIIEHSARALLANNKIKQVMICVAIDDRIWPTLALANNTRVASTIGGANRAQSVLNGLHALTDAVSDDWVLVHDAARPCLNLMGLDTLINELENDDVGGILAIPAKDTLKLAQPQSDSNNSISKTLDRSQIWQAQTPQMFRYGALKNSLLYAIESGCEITDEASAMERAGYHPKLVEGDAHNLKVTTPEDVRLAEFILADSLVKLD